MVGVDGGLEGEVEELFELALARVRLTYKVLDLNTLI